MNTYSFNAIVALKNGEDQEYNAIFQAENVNDAAQQGRDSLKTIEGFDRVITYTTRTYTKAKMNQLTEYEQYQVHLFHLNKDNNYSLYLKWVELAKKIKSGELKIVKAKNGLYRADKLRGFIQTVRNLGADCFTTNERTRAVMVHDMITEALETEF